MSLYKKYIKPLKVVQLEQKPLKTILLAELFNFFAITKPKKNEPEREIIKRLLIKYLKKVANKEAKISKKVLNLIFIYKLLSDNIQNKKTKMIIKIPPNNEILIVNIASFEIR